MTRNSVQPLLTYVTFTSLERLWDFMKTRIEVNENGEFYTIIPNEVVEEYNLDEGEQVEWDIDDPDLVIITFA